jgi:hypothetical protein
MKTALKWVGIALALLVAFVVIQLLRPLPALIYQNVSVPLYHWMGVTEHGRSMIAYLILTLAFALIGLLFLKEWIKEFGSTNFWWRDLFQLLLVEAFVLFFARSYCPSCLDGKTKMNKKTRSFYGSRRFVIECR